MPVYKRKEETSRKKTVDEWNKANKPIIITDDKDKVEEYECKYCRCTIRGKVSDNSIFCFHCQSEIFLDKDTRKALKTVKAHNTLDDGEVFVSYPQDINDMVSHTKYVKPSEPKGSFAELKRRGIKITHYEERGGDGRII